MTAHVLQYVELSDRDRQQAGRLPRLEKGDRLEMRVQSSAGGEKTVPLPASAVALISTLLDHLYRGERVAVLSEDQEITPNEASAILGISRPLVVHRMDIGDLPFRLVGKHRRTRLKDVLGLKDRLDAQRAAQADLAADTEELMGAHGL